MKVAVYEVNRARRLVINFHFPRSISIYSISLDDTTRQMDTHYDIIYDLILKIFKVSKRFVQLNVEFYFAI